MELKKTNCTECGSPIAIADDVQYINCAACGTFYAIERGEGYISLKAMEKLTKAIQDTGQGTQDVIRESTQVTRAELQRLQVTQAIAMAELKLSNLQSEIRGLERGSQTPKTILQIRKLHGIEYNMLEDLRKLHLNSASLGLQDFDSRIKTAEMQLHWLNSQKNILSETDFSSSYRKQVENELAVRISQVKKELSDIRTAWIKRELKNFLITTLPVDDLEEAKKFLMLLNEDEAKVRQMSSYYESTTVLQEILERKKKVSTAWNQLENNRISQVLRSPGQAINQNEIASLQGHLALVNEDLAAVQQMEKNNVVMEYERKLRAQQQSLLRQIGKLEKDARKAEERATRDAYKVSKSLSGASSESKIAGTGCVAGFFLALTGMFAGIAALFKEIIASISARKQTAVENATAPEYASDGTPPVPALSGAAQPAGAASSTPNEVTAIPTGQKVTTYPPRTPSGLQMGALLKGCLLSSVFVFGFFILGAILMVSAFPDYSTTGNSVGIGVLFLITGLGFALGSFIFVRNIAPLSRIKGVWKIKDFTINKHPKKPGLSNLLAIKGLMGLLTCLIVYFIFLSIAAMLPSDLVLWAFCPGVLLGPIIGALVSRQTYLAELDMMTI